MKKWLFALATSATVLSLAACNIGEENVAESKVGNITKDELYTEMKARIGSETLKELMLEKAFEKKAKVSDSEVNDKVKELKTQLGANFEAVLQQNQIKDEAALKKLLRFQLLREKALVADVKVSDKDVKAYYDAQKPEIQASHILVKDEKTAKLVAAQLAKGTKFADLAKKYSQDPGSAAKGGDLGWFGAGRMVKEFEEAAYALKVGEISKPVKSTFGYHIIKLTDKKEKQPFAKVKDKMKSDVQKSKMDPTKTEDTINKLLKDADIKVSDKDLKDAFKVKPVTATPTPQQ